LEYFFEVPITIELPDLASQTRLNLARWAEILADPALARLPHRIETDRLGRILMSPPPAFTHADRQGRIADFLTSLLPHGRSLPECPLSTADGVKAIDVAWLAEARSELVERPVVLTSAPEICIEILSPSNSNAEIAERRALYFDTGAAEVWICNLDGSISFFVGPDHHQRNSVVCPAFPDKIP
jgi:Uma2 family endonuclease